MKLLQIPRGLGNTFWGKAAKYQIIYSIAGLILGLICILGGIYLFLRGITGASSWIAKILGNESEITDAAPGAILFIVGLFIVIVTKYDVKVQK